MGRPRRRGGQTLSRIIKRATSWEDAATRGMQQRLYYESIGLALFQQVFQLLEAKNLTGLNDNKTKKEPFEKKDHHHS